METDESYICALHAIVHQKSASSIEQVLLSMNSIMLMLASLSVHTSVWPTKDNLGEWRKFGAFV